MANLLKPVNVLALALDKWIEPNRRRIVMLACPSSRASGYGREALRMNNLP
jgi:hypothetical protein